MARKGSYIKPYVWIFDHIPSKAVRVIVLIVMQIVGVPLSVMFYACRSVVEAWPILVDELRISFYDVVHWNE